ncbi:YTH domain family protein 1 OS=Mus musculus GN=Ythdf1 PE=2 SV=1 [Rhizoctonia solani AG-1 IB]|uniref:YTH domain family protein 1 n=1 Tax=Thanatephorus cucumeris (strain AG1-IB / isolate 7/3/14) TaxID=1108050 RepID=A0A0B7G3W6_THACB|nr:YTH domain family protein 1 OS=Mus musculus GN=Ythdf1 PE=2 SV=1 [Rhizoctonia solani AG-1 IB]
MEDIPTSPNDTVSPLGASVRRVHTISSSMRGRRHPAASEEYPPEYYEEDDHADESWNGAPGAIGDGKGALLHRQASLPTKYHRGFKSNRTGTQSGTLSPSGRNVSGLSVIAADHAGEGEEEWEHDMRNLRGDEHPSGEGTLSPLSGGNPYFQPAHSRSQSQTSNNGGGLSPSPYAPQPSISPPPASNIRRHTSLTANAAAGAAGRRRQARLAAERAAQSPSPPSPAHADNDHGHSPLSPIGRTPWGPATPPITTANKEWRSDPSIEDVQRQLGHMDLASHSQGLEVSTSPTPHRLSPGPNHPPRFRANSPQPGAPQQGQQMGSQAGFNGGGRQMAKLQLITDLTPPAVPPKQPQSAAASVPPIGHGIPQVRRWHGRSGEQGGYNDNGSGQRQDEKPFTASGVVWDQKDRIIGTRSGNNGFDASGAPPVPPLPQTYAGMMQPGMNFGGMNMGGLDTTSFARLGMNMGMMNPSPVGNMNAGLGQGRLQVNTAVGGPSQGMNNSAVGSGNGGNSPSGYLSPVDIPSLIVSKGYNPATFDIRPQFARYFVIKSYTEDDVHKSLKYEIWSSTDPGNKRLDKAFKECGGRGPIYLFFSVNASGHFCGMAEMLTPVDYTRSSTVWAQDKWKGVFKVRWIFVRDIPNAALRHIRLNNTQERKPVTNSRDTQELLPEAGHEMLRIFFTHPARTSLLQDFAFYELQSMQKISTASSPQAVQHPFAMANPSTLPAGQQQQLALQQQQLQLQMLQMQNQYQQQQMGMSRSPGPPSPYPGGLGNNHNGSHF